MQRSILALLTLFSATPCLAHSGPRFWVGAENGTITTFTSDNDLAPITYTPSQRFSTTLVETLGVYSAQFPGYELRRDGLSGITDGTTFGMRIAGPLLTLDAERLTSTIAIGGVNAPRLGVSRTGASRVSGSGVVDGYDFFTASGAGAHAHLTYTLLGDGVSSAAASPDGAYAIPFVLTSESYAASDWYILVMSKNATAGQLDAANAFAQRMIDAVPGDSDFDGSVDFDDLVTLAQNYNAASGKWWASGDFDFNGRVNFEDLVALAQNYGHASSFENDWGLAQAVANTPEPTSTLALLSSAAVFARRGRGDRATATGRRTKSGR